MGQQCQLCGKKPVSGHNVSHSNRHTKRRWLPNLVSKKLDFNGVTKRLKICTACFRTHYKNAKMALKTIKSA